MIEADRQIEKAREEGRLQNGDHILKIVIWHHPITGNDKIKEDRFVERLRKKGFRLCLHGHIHEDREDIIGVFDREKLWVAGTGSLGAPMSERPEAVPRLYNLLEIDRNLNLVRVYVRELETVTCTWKGRCKWPSTVPHHYQSYFEIPLAEPQKAPDKSPYEAIEKSAQIESLMDDLRQKGAIDDKIQIEFFYKNNYSS